LKIAVYTIALNEEQFVKDWQDSAKEADYLLIADTGSTDNTVAIAKSLGINVIEISISPWRFDDARNASLASLPKDIDMCISLDMDEVLVPGWREKLEGIKAGTTRPRYKYTWSWTKDGEPGLQYGGDKIHSRHGYRWKHPVHEVLVADRITEVQEWISLEIEHYPDESKSRGQYLPLLELAVSESPTDDRNVYYLAREYFFNRMYDKAKTMFENHLRLPSATWGPERAASYRYLAKCDPENAEECLRRAYQEAPGRREALVELSEYYYKKQDWNRCLFYAIGALETKEKPLDYLCEDFAWGSLPHDLAAIAAYNLGDIGEAIRQTELAMLTNNDPRLVWNLNHYLSIYK
jgi:glycosyltransferase involved in cell wall biosynthesis